MTDVPVTTAAGPMPVEPPNGAGAVIGTLRLEGVLALTLAALGYRSTGSSWWLFAALFLVPDLTMLGYVVGSRLRASIYNVGHTYLTPGIMAASGMAFDIPVLLPAALIWAAHIGFDRAMGYGLKYPESFTATHLGRNGGDRLKE